MGGGRDQLRAGGISREFQEASVPLFDVHFCGRLDFLYKGQDDLVICGKLIII